MTAPIVFSPAVMRSSIPVLLSTCLIHARDTEGLVAGVEVFEMFVSAVEFDEDLGGSVLAGAQTCHDDVARPSPAGQQSGPRQALQATRWA